MSDALQHTWSLIRSRLRQAVGEQTWSLWLADLTLTDVRHDLVVVIAPAETRPWIAERFERVLQRAAADALGRPVHVEITAAGRAREPHAAPAAAAAAPLDEPAPAGLNPRFTFDQFVIGDSNRLAHAACLAVAEMPGLAYNPLYVCGPPGLGKTHLLQSIANYLEEVGDGLIVRYVTGERFTNDFVAAIHHGTVETFKSAYRDVDVLLVDDVQFLERKAKTEEEFFHTFNALHATGAQVVLTSDRPPRDLDALEDRLRERFEAGLVAEVRPPDQSTRLTILRKRVRQDEVHGVHDAALELLADRIHGNIRMLEGALIRVVAFASLTAREIDAALAGEVLDGLYPATRGPRKRTVRDIQERTAAAFGVSVDQLVSSSRAQALTWARQVSMYLARELTDETLPAIGRAFGNRNHTTVLHACRRTAARIAEDTEAFDVVRRLTEELQRPDGVRDE